MSREIDLDQPLSDEDKAYLESRARHDLIADNETRFSGQPVVEPVNDGHTGDIDRFGVDDARDLRVGENPGETALTVVQAVEVGQPPEVHYEPAAQAGDAAIFVIGEGLMAEESVDAADNYDDSRAWSKRDLQGEAEGRGLETSGTRSEIVARLREDDAKDDEPGA